MNKKIELTCQQLFDAGINEIETLQYNYKITTIHGDEISSSYLEINNFTITDIPENGIAKKIDKNEWLGKPCWFYECNRIKKTLGILTAINKINAPQVYEQSDCGNFSHCELATKEEVVEWFEKDRSNNGD